jgi:excisionase family DNA binding protein
MKMGKQITIFHEHGETNVPALLTIRQLADYLNIKRSTLYAWVEQGFIPHYKMNRLIRFKKEEIDAWLEKMEKRGDESASMAKDFLDRLRPTAYNSSRVGRNQTERKESGKEECHARTLPAR